MLNWAADFIELIEVKALKIKDYLFMAEEFIIKADVRLGQDLLNTIETAGYIIDCIKATIIAIKAIDNFSSALKNAHSGGLCYSLPKLGLSIHTTIIDANAINSHSFAIRTYIINRFHVSYSNDSLNQIFLNTLFSLFFLVDFINNQPLITQA